MRLISCILFVFIMIVLGTVVVSERKETTESNSAMEVIQDTRYKVICIENHKFVLTYSGHITKLGGKSCAS